MQLPKILIREAGEEVRQVRHPSIPYQPMVQHGLLPRLNATDANVGGVISTESDGVQAACEPQRSPPSEGLLDCRNPAGSLLNVPGAIFRKNVFAEWLAVDQMIVQSSLTTQEDREPASVQCKE